MRRPTTIFGAAILIVGMLAGCSGTPGSATSQSTGTSTPSTAPASGSTPTGSSHPTTPPAGSSPAGSAPTASGPQPSDAETATALADSYEKALVAAKWQTAWDMLSATDQARRGSLAAFTAERSAFYKSVAGRYQLDPPTRDAASLAWWTRNPDIVLGADLARGYIVEASYPAIADNNAGWDVFLVAPDPSGAWRIWEVR